jgi:hypothetical protein
VAAHVFEKQRRPTALRYPVGYLGYLKLRVDFRPNALQLTSFFKRGYELP